ncbi:MAG: 3-phosphoserine/phosphohydroxythreonine transaminase [Fimbriimonadaceae bacterium]|nr:3-phosphoserine/phosphohydroxythreonine transaminase [Fimbriimonadaceae bacterium]
MALPYDRQYNFSAGPGCIPVPVLEQARDEMLNHGGDGMSVMEMSHRGKAYLKIAEEAEESVRTLMGVPPEYKVLFLQGGASLQFTMLAMNFLRGKTADYVVTGSWGEKAIATAKYEGAANLLWSGKAGGYTEAPDLGGLSRTAGASYLHVTTNETIQGVDYLEDPKVSGTVICDMSSCIASRPFDVTRYEMLYAGAQKNLGPSGACLVLLHEDMLERAAEGLPPMLDYKVQVENGWMYNTPPCYSVYVIGLVCKHWTAFGGLGAVEKMNREKAKVLYDAIDGSGGFYTPHAVTKNRSLMNIPFRLPSDDLTDKFLSSAKAERMHELKGHRSVGGCRASVYNAFPLEGCHALAQFMADFAAKNG